MDASSGSRAKGPAAGGVKSANSLRGRGAGRGPPLTIVQDVAIDGHVLRQKPRRMSVRAAHLPATRPDYSPESTDESMGEGCAPASTAGAGVNWRQSAGTVAQVDLDPQSVATSAMRLA
jgi:hypothetical protein